MMLREFIFSERNKNTKGKKKKKTHESKIIRAILKS